MTTKDNAPSNAAALHAALLSPSPVNIERCARALCEGDLVAFPTETVFGLGAAVNQAAAVAGIFKAKGRPADHPLIAHAAPGFDWSAGWIQFSTPLQQQQFEALTRAFWPGPLTLVLPKGSLMPLQVTGGQNSVGIRCPSHPVAVALLQAAGVPVAAPSANRFGKVSPTRAAHVMAELGDRLPWVLDGNIPEVGIESTIVSLLEATPRILRPGAITAAQLTHALGQSVQGFTQSSARKDNPRVSGALEKHYSPDAKVLVLDDLALNGFVPQGRSLCVGWSDGFLTQADALRTEYRDLVLVEALANTPQDVAKNLYSTLRQADALQCVHVVFERPGNGEDWEGVADRLKRASA
ncbi:MAG TPA: L-threonylcarbamoyladenylate synthase [Limnobacter sp.]|nr:L-threonylcarbamoyladenylate synthase [Limnobacter sp.]